MVELQLTKGKVALVDNEDFYWVSQWNWFAVEINGTWYARRSKKKGVLRNCPSFDVYLHRLISKCQDKSMVVDHIDHNGLNCQRSNLRICSRAENNRNVSPRKGSSSKYLGVFLSSEEWRKKRWVVNLKHDGKSVLRKRYLTEYEAAVAYDQAARKYHGEFANLNFV